MAVTLSSFRTKFPEFAEATDALIEDKISDAELLVDTVAWGNKADVGVAYLAAHLVAINPLGEMARLDKRGEKTTYLLTYERFKMSLGLAGCRVI